MRKHIEFGASTLGRDSQRTSDCNFGVSELQEPATVRCRSTTAMLSYAPTRPRLRLVLFSHVTGLSVRRGISMRMSGVFDGQHHLYDSRRSQYAKEQVCA